MKNRWEIEDVIKMTEEELEDALREASNKYYNDEEPIITDEMFDFMRELMEKKNSKNKFLVDIGIIPKDKIMLPYFMGSLDKITKKQSDKIIEWINKYKGPYILSDKLDGISCMIYRKNGKIKMFSKGTREYGRDISELKSIIGNIDFKKIDGDFALRGELIIKRKDFKKVKDKMKNSRNAVAGLVNSKHKDKEIMGITNFVAYSIYEPSMKKEEQMKRLKEIGFLVPYYEIRDDLTVEYLDKLLIERKKKSEYEIDGIVIEDNSKKYKVKNENPKHSFAYKSLSVLDIFDTEVEDVEWNISMDGFLKPRIKVKPIDHPTGVTINYVTGFNGKYIFDNKINKGTILSIVRSGDVIPYILGVVKSSKEPLMPTIPYKWNETGIDIIATTSKETIDKVAIKRITYFFTTLGIKNINEGIVRKLVNNGYDDIFKILQADKNDLIKIEGLGEKVITKIYNNIDNIMKNVKILKLMSGSRIFGRGIAEKKLEELINTIPNLLEREITIDEVMKVEGFGEKMSKKFIDNLGEFKKFYEKMNKIYEIKTVKTKKIGDKFKSQNIVMTGFRDKELEELITSNGGKISNSVSSKTTLLICNDKNEESSKMKKAKELGIKIITKSDFIEKIKMVL